MPICLTNSAYIGGYSDDFYFGTLNREAPIPVVLRFNPGSQFFVFFTGPIFNLHGIVNQWEWAILKIYPLSHFEIKLGRG